MYSCLKIKTLVRFNTTVTLASLNMVHILKEVCNFKKNVFYEKSQT